MFFILVLSRALMNALRSALVFLCALSLFGIACCSSSPITEALKSKGVPTSACWNEECYGLSPRFSCVNNCNCGSSAAPLPEDFYQICGDRYNRCIQCDASNVCNDNYRKCIMSSGSDLVPDCSGYFGEGI